ncbi:hypothetical protein BUALT_Bualt16G0049700 [Buddleja alternifolia]|uniref:Uncharacterized protein n=1 Tax=Buddleja alternifolia TaxID=168488 RepID=A0AAV6WAQ6_9LAMI|nr:hypothetical protein BUALT_Bualt16G0049700 [Buddleja alternifolia]
MHLPSATSAKTVGTGMLAISTWLPQLRPPPCHEPTIVCEQATSSQMAMLYVSLYVIAVRTGGLKSSVSGFDGTQKYRYKKTSGSPVVQILQVIVAAVKKKGLEAPKDANLLYETTVESLKVHHTDQFKFLDKAAIITKEDYAENSDMSPNPWTLCSITKVKEVKMIRLLPIWATTIIFWTTYAQIITFSVVQASTMDRHVGSFEIPSGSLTVFFVAAILISLAVYDRDIIPLCKKFRGKPGKRSRPKRNNGTSKKFLLIPQFLFVGIGEAFIYTGQLDFFITQYITQRDENYEHRRISHTLPLGFFMSSLLVSVVKTVTTGDDGKGWVGDRINNGRLDCFYGLLAILSFIDFWLFLLSVKWYRSQRNKKVLQMESFGKDEEKCKCIARIRILCPKLCFLVRSKIILGMFSHLIRPEF